MVVELEVDFAFDATTNTFTSDIFSLLEVNLSLIGIDVVDAG
ncbi:unnamed protein product, partial [marine sediment metagenome]